jgi:hypothetical protein
MKLFIEAWFLYSRKDLFMDETFFLSERTIRPARYLHLPPIVEGRLQVALRLLQERGILRHR